MIGPDDQLDRTQDVKHLLGKQVVVEERIEHAGERGHAGGNDDRVHLVAERVDAGRAGGVLVLADRKPEIADPAAQQEMADDECQHGRGEQNVVEHRRPAAQQPQVVAGVLLDRQEKSGRAADPAEMVEADAGEFRKGDRQNGEIDARDPEAKRQEADDRADRPSRPARRSEIRARDRCRSG